MYEPKIVQSYCWLSLILNVLENMAKRAEREVCILLQRLSDVVIIIN